MSNTPFQNVLEHLRKISLSEREKGARFEELTYYLLKHEPSHQDRYANVYMWSQWAELKKISQQDTGIDLVAVTHDKQVHAIQCKFYDDNAILDKDSINSFLAESIAGDYDHRVLVYIAKDVSKHARTLLNKQNKSLPITEIRQSHFEDSSLDWIQYLQAYKNKAPTKGYYLPKKTPLEHQKRAVKEVRKGFKHANRGKLIMACGTGKTFTAFQLAQVSELCGKGGRCLFLAPSLALIDQTIREWNQEKPTNLRMNTFAVCSDSKVGKSRQGSGDELVFRTYELSIPATTNAQDLAESVKRNHKKETLTVVFSTYHSIEVIHQAQKKHKLAGFDLIICDEAHRTTGATFEGEQASHFVRIHDNKYVKGKKRLYMTATPRLYADKVKHQADLDDTLLCSMDDEKLYGDTFFTLNFTNAVELDLLCDYKVVVLCVSADDISKQMQRALARGDIDAQVDDVAKIIGCWKALSHEGKRFLEPMRRAVAFCQVIDASKTKRSAPVGSIQISKHFSDIIDEHVDALGEDNRLACEVEHIDGSMNADKREQLLSWLKSDPEGNSCHILSNVRCLSEGVDVPALDAVMFLSPKNSQVDVVQSVGRVMRKSAGKKYGYVILPVVIPPNMPPSDSLDKSDAFKVVWDVLQALRSHDDSLSEDISKRDLDKKYQGKIEVIALSDQLKAPQQKNPAREATSSIGKAITQEQVQQTLDFSHDSAFDDAIYAKMVKRCGTRRYWETWAKDIGEIAQKHISRIKGILNKKSNTKEIKAFEAFVEDLQDTLNTGVTRDDVIEMIAQHMITQPVFDALFDDYQFSRHNPISQAMARMVEVLQPHRIKREAKSLEAFYDSVRQRAQGIQSLEAKQKIIVELYETFFTYAFPDMVEKLGIAYTPVEVVDFVIHSINDLLQKHFQKTLGSPDVHIIDPFTGTGTFITRLLSSEHITPEQLKKKFNQDIHANEIVLLAYYIAAINIESVYHERVGGAYQPFEGICLTDTFQSGEIHDHPPKYLRENQARIEAQEKATIQVIMGNPPYSIGQKSENDNNQNMSYPNLEQRILNTYAEKSSANLKKGLYDSYIMAIRWASDRIGDSGILGFVTNAGFLDSASASGVRHCLAQEFSSLYVFNLRGNQRTQGEESKKEGGKIFGGSSRTPIAISLLVKDKNQTEFNLFYHDIGDYLKRDDKLNIIQNFKSIGNMQQQEVWQNIQPDEHDDWINQRNPDFYHPDYWSMGDKSDKTSNDIFDAYSQGVITSRDAWCYNSSKKELGKNIKRMLDTYHIDLLKYQRKCKGDDPKKWPALEAKNLTSDKQEISWSRALKNKVSQHQFLSYQSKLVRMSLYRPFSKQYLYFTRDLNECVYQMPACFPVAEASNELICIVGIGESVDFSCLMSNLTPNYHFTSTGQCFPRYVYDLKPKKSGNKLEHYTKREAITDEALEHFRKAYAEQAKKITKEHLFYYIYGLLHHPDYRKEYEHNLVKQLPRIPRVKTYALFAELYNAGKALAKLHRDYEKQPLCEAITVDAGEKNWKKMTEKEYYVTKMKLPNKDDSTALRYNKHITLRDIPKEAWEYQVNGKAALTWVMERQRFKKDKASAIENDANLYATETMKSPVYPLELFLRVATVSIETMKIVRSLPKLDI